MPKLAFFKINWSARKVLNIFIIWTTIWLIILFWKVDLLSQRDKKVQYRISTPGCQIQESKTVSKFLFWLNTPHLYVPKCPTTQFKVTGRKVQLEKTQNVKSCTLTPFKRLTDEQNAFDLSQEISFRDFHTVTSENTNFFQLECFSYSNSSGTSLLKDYGLLTPSFEAKPDIKSFLTSPKMFSILILGFNQVTNADADIQLKRTMQFLREESNFLEFRGFNGLSPNSIENMLAILTGRKNYIVPHKSRNFQLDMLDFVWEAYKANKFYTVFGENTCRRSLFNSLNVHFMEQPTDYYLRPFLLQIANDNAFEPPPEVVSPIAVTDPYILEKDFKYSIPPHIKEKCKGSRHEQHIVLELMEQLLPFYLKRLTFSFYWFSRKPPFLPHDDAAIANILKKYKEAGVFNRTFVFVVSHVNRFQPKVFKSKWLKQPILFASVPENFKIFYPEEYGHFKANTLRLITPYDLHATLLQLANFTDPNFTAKASSLTKVLIEGRLQAALLGTSLFNKTIATTRTCRLANIPEESCLCRD